MGHGKAGGGTHPRYRAGGGRQQERPSWHRSPSNVYYPRVALVGAGRAA